MIFSGRVTSVEKKAGSGSRAHFRVEEAVRGIRSATVDVDTAATSCGYSFESGARYLVYAWPRSGEDRAAALTTSSCDRTRPLEEGRDDLNLLRALGQGRPLTRAFGSLRVMPEPPNESLVPVPGAIVVASGTPGRFETKTNATGRYRFENLPPGSYELTVTWPKGYHDFYGRKEVAQIEVVPPVCGVERDFFSEIDAKK